MAVLASLASWLRLKRYQIEVTYSVYMFTPTEKFVFYSIAFLLISLTTIATILYLPHYLASLANRALFYLVGDDSVDVLGLTKDAIYTLVKGTGLHGHITANIGASSEEASSVISSIAQVTTAVTAAAKDEL